MWKSSQENGQELAERSRYNELVERNKRWKSGKCVLSLVG